MPVTLEYVAKPYFDPERLRGAAEEMKRKLPELAGSDRLIEFEPLLCDTTRLFLTLPRGEAGPQREERKAATINLRTGILDAITLPMRDFQGLFDALFGNSAVVFQGEIVIELDTDEGIPAERVPMICRLADLVGDIFDVDVEQDPTSRWSAGDASQRNRKPGRSSGPGSVVDTRQHGSRRRPQRPSPRSTGHHPARGSSDLPGDTGDRFGRQRRGDCVV